MKRVLILDLDNTIYPVKSVANDMFDFLFELIDEELGATDPQKAEEAKHELTRRPFQQIADDFGFSDELKSKGIEVLRSCEYNKPMQPYDVYSQLQKLDIDKYLVTTGFTKLQLSKVKMLGVAEDFKKVYVVDPEESSKTKGDVFQKIMVEGGYKAEEVLVIGDDPKSEIKFAKQLGIDTYLFDPENKYSDNEATYRQPDYREVSGIINQN
ncbi:HAD family hydrolase [Mucilaginibacter pallidiroseus]|uniref:HAD family hydrolase n=1 Tax=Mucilaginibacter pallidiroseus TaxID=2599295 RepID=A0A563U0H6_9SPHI|nr:HAD family hydrolase [Mucilaginibacter pallidiroseus]TWR25137.1 HAD family hydrolase [Mucilaginibacter pallidiroseus]